jgi:arylformamidase
MPPMSTDADDLAWREREYSPSSAIGGNYQPFVARYARDSALAVARVPALRDLRYGDAQRALLDFFPAKNGNEKTGLLVFIHGGYWQELSKNESSFLAPAWHDAGFAHATIGYTLAPEATISEIVDQCVSAIDWLKSNASKFSFDADNIVVAGSSAGAYLAAACAARTPLRGIVLVSGVFDVAPLIGTSINDALRLDESAAASRNLMQSTSHFAPAVVAWGEIETSEFKRQSRAFAAKLVAHNVACVEFEIAARNHFDVIHELGDANSRFFREARALFKQYRIST